MIGYYIIRKGKIKIKKIIKKIISLTFNSFNVINKYFIYCLN